MDKFKDWSDEDLLDAYSDRIRYDHYDPFDSSPREYSRGELEDEILRRMKK